MTVGCTGVSASWCPVCGDCACPVDDRGEHVSTLNPGDYGKDDPACPLHARSSKHAEGPCAHDMITRTRDLRWRCVQCGLVREVIT